MSSHELEITFDQQVRRGRRIRYRCPDCDARGDLTAPPAKAMELFTLLARGHRQSAEGRGQHGNERP